MSDHYELGCAAWNQDIIEARAGHPSHVVALI